MIEDLVDYDPDTGKLTWNQHLWRTTIEVGDPVGGVCTTLSGHRQVCYKGKYIYTHRLCWKKYYGVWPEQDLDHIDGDPLNNKINNLRLCNKQQNRANSKTKKLYKGVVKTFRKNHPWKAQIKCNDKLVHLGVFKTEIEAARAYDVAAKEFFGEFASPNFKDNNNVNIL